MKNILAILTVLGSIQAHAHSLVSTQVFDCSLTAQGQPAGHAEIERKILSGRNSVSDNLEIVFDADAAAVIAKKYGPTNYIRGGYAREVLQNTSSGVSIPAMEVKSYNRITNLRYVGDINTRASITTDVSAQFRVLSPGHFVMLFKAADRGLTAEQERLALEENPDLSVEALAPHSVSFEGVCAEVQK